MMDALLFAVRDGLRAWGMGYDARNCEIMPDGQPPPRCGEIFLAIHGEAVESRMRNAFDKYFNFSVTLTMRVTVPLDRVGDQRLARKLARKESPDGQLSFNGRVEQIESYLHMAWGLLQDANTFLVQWEPDAGLVYGFVEPAKSDGHEVPVLVGGEWFSADQKALDVGLKSEIYFVEARRLQPIALYT